MTKLRCYECEQRKPEDDTTLVSAMIGGDYRRAPRRGHVRICRECAQEQVAYAVHEQAADRTVPINSGRINWEQAIRFFGIEIPSGTLIDRMTGRREP